MKRLLVAAALALTLAGCGEYTPSPKCIKSHQEVKTVPEYTPNCGLGIDGSFDCGKMKMKWVTKTVTVCDEYEKPSPTPSKEADTL